MNFDKMNSKGWQKKLGLIRMEIGSVESSELRSFSTSISQVDLSNDCWCLSLSFSQKFIEPPLLATCSVDQNFPGIRQLKSRLLYKVEKVLA